MNPVSPIAKAITALLVPLIVKLAAELGVNDLDVTTLQVVVLAGVSLVAVYLVPNRSAA